MFTAILLIATGAGLFYGFVKLFDWFKKRKESKPAKNFKKGTYGHPVNILDQVEKVLTKVEFCHYTLDVMAAKDVPDSVNMSKKMKKEHPNDAILVVGFFEPGALLEPTTTKVANLTRTYDLTGRKSVDEEYVFKIFKDEISRWVLGYSRYYDGCNSSGYQESRINKEFKKMLKDKTLKEYVDKAMETYREKIEEYNDSLETKSTLYSEWYRHGGSNWKVITNSIAKWSKKVTDDYLDNRATVVTDTRTVL